MFWKYRGYMAPSHTLFIKMICPSCNVIAELEIELNFGDPRKQYQYTVGDRMDWRPRASHQNGGRPKNGNLDGEGSACCSNCGDRYIVKVIIREDQIVDVLFDAEKSPFITPWPDYTHQTAQMVEIPDVEPVPPFIEPGLPYPGKIDVDLKWLTAEGQEALTALAALGVSVYMPSSIAKATDFRILIPHNLRSVEYIKIAYLMAQIVDRAYKLPPVEFVDSYPHGLKYRMFDLNKSGQE
jgi:hypothetical protein